MIKILIYFKFMKFKNINLIFVDAIIFKIIPSQINYIYTYIFHIIITSAMRKVRLLNWQDKQVMLVTY